MRKELVYRFTQYDIALDKQVMSTRMATREKIARIDKAVIVPETETEIESKYLSDGMTDRNFNPSAN